MSIFRTFSQSLTHNVVPSAVRSVGPVPPALCRPKRAFGPVPSVESHTVGKPANSDTAAVDGSTR